MELYTSSIEFQDITSHILISLLITCLAYILEFDWLREEQFIRNCTVKSVQNPVIVADWLIGGMQNL